jgi:hypothetical protein
MSTQARPRCWLTAQALVLAAAALSGCEDNPPSGIPPDAAASDASNAPDAAPSSDAANAPDAPAVPPYAFRGIYDGPDHASYPSAFTTMHLSASQVTEQDPANGGTAAQLLTELGELSPPAQAFVWMKGYVAVNDAQTGGSFKVDDLLLRDVMTYSDGSHTVATHPANTHRYVLFDEDNVIPMTTGGWAADVVRANLGKLADRYALLHTYDPNAIVVAVDSNQSRFGWYADTFIGRPICDELWLDGYPYSTAGYQSRRIPDQASWAEGIGKPYVGLLQVFAEGDKLYPTTSIVDQMWSQWTATNMRGVVVYAWDDGSPPSLSSDPAMQAHLGSLFAP